MSNIKSLLMEKFNIISQSEIKNGFEKLTVEKNQIKSCISFLKNSAESSVDMLVSITATDYVEKIELLYHLYSTKLNENIFISTNVDAACPTVESISSVFKSATNEECEIFDLFGIEFENNKCLKRLFLPKEYVGSPMLKNQKYQQIENLGKEKDTISAFETTLQIETDGDSIKSVIPVIGKNHKQLEKTAEEMSFSEYLEKLTDVFFKEAFCEGVEKLSGATVSDQAKYTRVLLCELERIKSHLGWAKDFLALTGPYFAHIQAKNELEEITNLTEKSDVKPIFGGVSKKLDTESLENIEKFIANLSKSIAKFDVSSNKIFKSGLQNIGILPKNTALNYAITGVNLRASGICADVRKKQPYLVYENLDFETPTSSNGDCFDRFSTRIAEIKESVKILEQCTDYLKSDDKCETVNVVEIPAGTAVSLIEAPTGLLGCTIISDGGEKPYRVKWRAGSFYSAQILPYLLKDRYYSDFSQICGSLDIKTTEVDR